jgi:TolC family type I secretion outer membrane protein
MNKLLLVMLIASHTGASFAANMTLNEAYQLALAKDAKLASSEAQLEASKELPEQAFAQLLPQITASASDKKEEYQLPGNPLFLNENTNNKNIQITQVLYNRQAMHTLDQAGLKVDYARLHLAGATNELGVRVAQAYLNTLLTQENLIISEQQVNTTEKRLAQVTAALKVGYSTKVDKLSLQAELDDAKAKRTSDQQQLIFFRQKLTVFIGQEISHDLPWPVIDAHALVNQFVRSRFWLEEAKNNNFDVQIQQKSIEIAQQEVDIRQSAFYPTVNLGGYYSDASGASYFAQKNDNKVIYVEVKIPLYQGGYDSARVRESKALLRSAEFDAAYAKSDATQQAQEQLSAAHSSREKLDALTHAITSGELYLASAEEGYRLGVRDITEVSRAKEKLYAHRRDQIRTSVELLNALIQLHAVSGQLDAQTINQISRAVW